MFEEMRRELYIEELERITNFYEAMGRDRNYIVELYMHNLIDDIPIIESQMSFGQQISVGTTAFDRMLSFSTARDTQMFISGFLAIDRSLAKQMASRIKQYANKNNGRCLEIMAGLGCLSYALREQGVEVITTDLKIDNECFKNYNNTWVDVEEIDCTDAIKKYGADVDFIICSWPRKSSPMIEVIDVMREVNPDCILIYIGEGSYGCCACEEFFDHVNTVDFAPIDVKNWIGIYDYCEWYN